MDYDQKLLVIIMAYFYLRHIRPRLHKRKRENSSTISGHDFTLELLRGNNNQCFELLRMSSEAYVRLCAHFRARGLLKDSKHISVEEKLAIFLCIIGGNQRYAVLKHRFQHSTQTINKLVNEVSDAMLEFAIEVIVPTSFDPSPEIHGNNTRLRQIFKGAVGVLDGILINAVIPTDKRTLYKRRENGECCQNVMAICDFNMMFTYIVAGWEGIADDSQVLSAAIADTDAGFPFLPPDKYYLCDTAYGHTRGYMTPYRNVRYLLGDFRNKPAMNKNEEFNHAHAKLRDVIERAFGVLKARFPVLKKMISFPIIKQRDVTIACFAIHNFIRKESVDDELFAAYEQELMIFDDENDDDDNDDDDDDDDELDDDDDDDELDDEEYDDPDVVRVIVDLRKDRQFMVNLREEITGQLMQDRD